MTAVETIERVLRSDVLSAALIYVPDAGATSQELAELSRRLPRALSESHVALLKRWNGLNLEVVRLYSASSHSGELRNLAEAQLGPIGNAKDAVVFGDDPAGFVYAETATGEIISFDSSLGDVKPVASSLDDFFGRLVFGKDAVQFAGEGWGNDLRHAGLV